MRYSILAMAVLTAACERGEPPAPDDAVTANATDAISHDAAPPPPSATRNRNYVGRWIGVEGMVLDVAAGAAPGRYRLTMQYDLDHRQTTEAMLKGDALAFTRDGRSLTLRPTDGKATGLKYLAAEHDCLTVASGEGYCRD